MVNDLIKDNNFAIKVSNLTKVYFLYNKLIDRMKEALHPFRKKYHHSFYALDNISFSIKKGETVGIIGKNGAGKSTLLKVLTGVLTPTAGNVNVNGRVSSLLELGIGFNPELTGLENIYFSATVNGFTTKQTDEKLEKIISFADIGDFIHQPVKKYSSGMFARLAFAVAINVEPDILIIDEALSVGDMAFQAKCFNKFKEFREKGVTILFVTHSVDTVIKYCQSAILIDSGKVIKDGNSKEVVELFRKMMVNTARKKVEEDRMKNKKEDTIKEEQIGEELLKKQLPLNNKAIIYGSMEAEIIDFALINEKGEVNNQIYHGENYIIQMSVKFYEEIIEPIFAFTIKSVDGLELTGTNSMNLDILFGTVKKGEIITVQFSQKMILNSGNYFLALGCTKFQEDNLKVFHRIYDAIAIEVLSVSSGTGIAFVGSDFEFIRE